MSHKEQTLFIQGNEAIAKGALASGCNFFAGYPITPASEITEIMSHELPRRGGSFIQMEDEIASMGAIIGASLAGAKSLTATSGPGFSLMQENIGFASITEVPCVIVNVMRGGASTGLPTNSGQGDVMQARWGTHGDRPAIVLCTSSVSDCFSLTVKAFNLAERFRTPVILLSDEIVSHTREKIILPCEDKLEILSREKPSMPHEWYIPYEDTEDGVPAMAAFGDGYRYHVTGLTHDINGFPTRNPDEIEAFVKRLFRKISNHKEEIQIYENFKTDDADITVIAYGSVVRSALRAVKIARKMGIKAGLLKLSTLFPFPKIAVQNVASNSIKLIIPEMNTGQISKEVRRVIQNDLVEVIKLNRIDGSLITPEEILKYIKEVD